jgi:hypothetical protein
MAVKKIEGAAEIVSTTASQPANIPAATEFDAAGAPKQIVPDVDVNHPAVDNDPRAGTTVEQNKIDFNDPTVSGQVAVERALGYKSAEDHPAEEKGE